MRPVNSTEESTVTGLSNSILVVDYKHLALELRKNVKGTIACDACSDSPLIIADYEGSYEIILCSLSLLAALSTEEEFNQVITK